MCVNGKERIKDIFIVLLMIKISLVTKYFEYIYI